MNCTSIYSKLNIAKMSEEFWIKLIDLSPFILSSLVSIIVPLRVIRMQNKQMIKTKDKEHEFELKKLQESKKIDSKHNEAEAKKRHEKLVHSSLLKILFEVQQLHLTLSSECDDYSCIDDAIKKCNLGMSKYQGKIADNQIYLSPIVFDHIYKFYSLLGDLFIELRNLGKGEYFELAIVSVHEYSKYLADEILHIQDILTNKRDKLIEELNSINEDSEFSIASFRSCCGQEPPEWAKLKIDKVRADNYKIEQIKMELNKLPEKIEPAHLNGFKMKKIKK